MARKLQFFPINISHQQVVKGSNHMLRIFVSAGLWIILFIVSFSIYTANKFLNFFGSSIGLFLMCLASFLIGGVIMRFLGMHENSIKKMVKERQVHEVTVMSDLWKINNSVEGLTYCLDNSTRVFIKCRRGYTINRPENFRDIHNASVARFEGYLLQLGYYLDWHNIYVPDGNIANLVYMENNLRKCKNAKLQELGAAILQNYRSNVSAKSASIYEFFIVSTYDLQMASTMLENIKTALGELDNSLYTDFEILDNNGVIIFAGETLLKLRGINIESLKENQIIDNDYIAARLVSFTTDTGKAIAANVMFDNIERARQQEEKEKEAQTLQIDSEENIEDLFAEFDNISSAIPMVSEEPVVLETPEKITLNKSSVEDEINRLLNSVDLDTSYVGDDFYNTTDDDEEI